MRLAGLPSAFTGSQNERSPPTAYKVHGASEACAKERKDGTDAHVMHSSLTIQGLLRVSCQNQLRFRSFPAKRGLGFWKSRSGAFSVRILMFAGSEVRLRHLKTKHSALVC